MTSTTPDMLELSIVLQTETCFSGSDVHRAAGVDTDVMFDRATGLPIIRGKSLKGLLVAQAAVALRALGSVPRWREAAEALFGVPKEHRTSKLRFSDATLSRALRDRVARRVQDGLWSPSDVIAALTSVRRQTRIDGETGTAEDGSLRATRLLRRGLEFRASMVCDGPMTHEMRWLLAACAACTGRAGLHRNRGWGEVQVRVLSHGVDVTQVWIEETPVVPDAAESATQPAVSPARLAPSGGQAVLEYHLRLQQPVVLATFGHDPNRIDTLDFISGASVLGAMAGRYLQQFPTADPARDETFRRLFLDGSVRWLHAYPAARDGSARLLPIELGLRVEKGKAKPRDAWDATSAEALPGNMDLRGYEGRYGRLVTPEDDGLIELHHRKTRTSVQLHINRSDELAAGRPVDGGIFTLEAVDSGEVFAGLVLAEKATDLATVRALLGFGPIALGRSRAATYGGHATVDIGGTVSWAGTVDIETTAGTEAVQADATRVVVTLQSDYLGRCASGAPDPRQLLEDLRPAIGTSARVERAFLRPKHVSGYVSKWRMPRPNHPALAAGSVFVIVDAGLDAEGLARIAWDGIGERRAEGFGRVSFRTADAPEIRLADADFSTPTPTESVSDLAVAELERRMLVGRLAPLMQQLGVEHARGVRGALSPALIARFRGVVRTAWSPASVRSWLDAVDREQGTTKSAAKALARVRLESQPLIGWIRHWIGGADGSSEAGWIASERVQKLSKQLRIEVDILSQAQRWALLQTHLDAFCEAARRAAQTTRDAGEKR